MVSVAQFLRRAVDSHQQASAFAADAQSRTASAAAQLAQAKAMLANAQAVQGRTELDVNRYTPLAREQAASQQDLDNAIQNNIAAKANIATAEAQIKSAQAAVETASLYGQIK